MIVGETGAGRDVYILSVGKMIHFYFYFFSFSPFLLSSRISLLDTLSYPFPFTTIFIFESCPTCFVCSYVNAGVFILSIFPLAGFGIPGFYFCIAFTGWSIGWLISCIELGLL